MTELSAESYNELYVIRPKNSIKQRVINFMYINFIRIQNLLNLILKF